MHDNNYHLMVSLLIKLLNERVSLRVEVPEWYPTIEKIGNSGEEVKNLNCNEDERMGNTDMGRKVDNNLMWKKPKKVVRPLKNEKEIMVKSNQIYFKSLSFDEEEHEDKEEDVEEEEHDDTGHSEIRELQRAIKEAINQCVIFREKIKSWLKSWIF